MNRRYIINTETQEIYRLEPVDGSDINEGIDLPAELVERYTVIQRQWSEVQLEIEDHRQDHMSGYH